jgi:hypothetical protein
MIVCCAIQAETKLSLAIMLDAPTIPALHVTSQPRN